MALGRRHCRTLCAIFEEPTRADVRWRAFESLVRALSGEVMPGGRAGGSRRRVKLRDVRQVFHKPHPRPEMPKGSVESARRLLRTAGVTPRSEGCEC